MSQQKRKKLRKDRVILLSLLILFIIFALCVTISKLNKSNINYQVDHSILNNNNSIDITISAVGDIMVHDDQLKAQYDKDTNSYSFDNNFKHIKPYIENSNLSIGNLETTLAGKDSKYSAYPRFNSPDSLVTALSNCGFDVLSTVNNHTYDKGSIGVYRTLDVIKNHGIESVGTRNNSSENNFIIKNVDGINLGITSFSYGQISKSKTSLNGLPIANQDTNNLNIFDFRDVDTAFESIKSTLDSMNQNETDLQVLVIHWGEEYHRNPSKFQRLLAQKLCDYGVDIIIGSHPHVVQPIEMIKSEESNNETLVIYSLGNFLSNQRREILKTDYTEDGLIVNIDISKNLDTNETKISKVEYIPTWVNKYTDSSNKLQYEIIPIVDETTILSINNLDYDKINKSYINTTSLIASNDIIKVKTN